MAEPELTVKRLAHIILAIALSAIFGYSLITGNMIGRRSLTPVEGRESAPILYWIYILGIAMAAAYFTALVFFARKKQK